MGEKRVGGEMKETRPDACSVSAASPDRCWEETLAVPVAHGGFEIPLKDQ